MEQVLEATRTTVVSREPAAPSTRSCDAFRSVAAQEGPAATEVGAAVGASVGGTVVSVGGALGSAVGGAMLGPAVDTAGALGEQAISPMLSTTTRLEAANSEEARPRRSAMQRGRIA